MDSGAAGNFMDFSLARSLKVPSDSLATPLTVNALDGRPLGPGKVILLTSPLHLSIHEHQEESFPSDTVSSVSSDSRSPLASST